VREVVPAVPVVRSGSEGGDQTGGKQTAAGGAAPLHCGEVTGVEAGMSLGGSGSLGLGREGENATANSMAGKGP
jgi:hypothetical protein